MKIFHIKKNKKNYGKYLIKNIGINIIIQNQFIIQK